MIIESFRVQNFRSIFDETLHCDQLTALVGPNGSGKSSFLRALQLFYTPNSTYIEDDFYGGFTDQEIIVAVTFSNLTPEEKDFFKRYVDNQKLTVEKHMKYPASKSSQKYYGSRLQNPDFDAFRSATGRASLTSEYNKLRDGKYPELPDYSNKENALVELQTWEDVHPTNCIRKQDDGQFFGFKEVGTAHLEKSTIFIFVPAVRDASVDVSEGKNSPMKEIMDLVVRSVLEQKNEIKELKKNTQMQYNKLVDPDKLTELKTLEKALGNTLKTFVPDSDVDITWLTSDNIEIPMPKADIKLMEDNYCSAVECVGHGLQRAFILTMLQHLSLVQSTSKENATEKQSESEDKSNKEVDTRIPNLILAIEEPELYQHPNRQRHLSSIFLDLATGSIKGVAEQTQIIYCTHSPLFVDIKRFNNIRAIHKVRATVGKPKVTLVKRTTHDEVAKIIERADGKPAGTYTGNTLKPRLQTIMTPWMNEGFFSDLAVLVEGMEDRAVILGLSSEMGYNFESKGISIIPCNGKTCIDRPTAIFKQLDIPVYIVWDSDYGVKESNKEENHRLLRLMNYPTIIDWPKIVDKEFACFYENLTTTFHEEIGKRLCTQVINSCCKDFCLAKNQAIKNPLVIQKIIKKAKENGKSSPTLEKIVSQIVTLRGM